MYPREKQTLKKIAGRLKKHLPNRIVSVHAFGSRVRGDHNAWSDFDVLVVVHNKNPEIEARIIEIFVEEETKSDLSFTPVIKDAKAFELERRFHTPFFDNIVREGVAL